MILYGIPTCDTCKKALKALETAGHAVTFRDIRKDPLIEAEIAEIVTEFGSRIINKQSTTYRGFPISCANLSPKRKSRRSRL